MYLFKGLEFITIKQIKKKLVGWYFNTFYAQEVLTFTKLFKISNDFLQLF